MIHINVEFVITGTFLEQDLDFSYVNWMVVKI